MAKTTTYQTTERLPYSARQMFDLVAAVDDYVSFMPLCERSVITERRTLDDGREELKATLEVLHTRTGLGGTFESLVHIDPKRMTITALSSDGPVRHLENLWRFEDLDDNQSRTTFSIHFQMRNWPMQVVMNRVYTRVFEKIAEAFRDRAATVYGRPRFKPRPVSPTAEGPTQAR